MIYPTFKDFCEFAQYANVIPVVKEISADLETPVSSFLKLDKDDYAFLLESVEGQEKIARYSFLGNNPSIIFQSKGPLIEIINRKEKKKRLFRTQTTPLKELESFMQEFKPAQIKGLPRFYGGCVGFIGYDVVRFFENIPDKNPDELGFYDMVFMLADTVLVFDHVKHTIKIVANCLLPPNKPLSVLRKRQFYKEAIQKIDAVEKAFNKKVAEPLVIGRHPRPIKFNSNFDKSSFCDIVNKAKRYIRCGEIIQVVISQRFKTKIRQEPFVIYRRLRSLNPSPYMFFLKLKDLTLVGASPELLVRCENGVVQTRPIAGTRRRGINEKEDKTLEDQLLQSVKEKAEHLMLVDLGRNDIGRVSIPGTVRVNTFMAVERYSHVMHLVSDISGKLAKKFTAFDALTACFPAGTVTGSPKVRAMEIIDELENVRRGPYAGCVGYVSFSGTLDTCITIRTIIIKDGNAYVQAGAGIVSDSIPEREYKETLNKAHALFEALRQT
ncbi:MAG: anthranilate synthase component I [Candidatus Omnitrophica bacterium]|nr:anthranilate synthase component I [Candidatus Omnitrophota bacterium]